MTRRLRVLWEAPRAQGATGPSWRDWVLVAVLLSAACAEAALRSDLVWRPVALAVGLLVVLVMPWRRLQPGLTAGLAFGSIAGVQIASIVFGSGAPVGLTSSACVLILVYAVARWGSGREMTLVAGLLVLLWGLGYQRDYHTVGDAIAEAVVLCLPFLLGLAVRAQISSRSRELEQVRISEREQLARELHDTVAHHVSAMVVQAQAGRIVATNSPDAAIEALRVIEEEGSRTLAEMRVLVGALRTDAALSPTASVHDIIGLSRGREAGVPVVVGLEGDMDDVHPSVAAAVFRIAQESVTNATRHASGASGIDVRVRAEGDALHVVVRDDGHAPKSDGHAGFGIVGMTERAALLGGSLRAGPGDEGGWVVDATLPRSGVAR